MSSKDKKDLKESVNLFSVKNVSREFGKKRLRIFKDNRVLALNDINLEINEMDAIGIVGESGSGKTTLGRILVGLEQPTKGEVLYKGKEIKTYSVKEKKWFHHQTQMIFQNPFASLNPYRSVLDILESGFKSVGKVDKKEVRKKIIDLLSEVGMHEDALNRYPHQFSGGQRQRLVIARALSVDPKILIADEPVSALDVSIQAQILNLLENLQKDLGLSFVFIAHDLSVVRHIADQVAVMYLGKIVEVGDSATVYNSPAHPYTKALLSAVPVANPSLRNSDKRIRLVGDVPSPIDPPSGCRFRTRCWKATDLCGAVEPLLQADASGRAVACHFPEEAAVSVG